MPSDPGRVVEASARPVRLEGLGSGWTLPLRDVTEARRAGERLRRQARLAAVGQLAADIAHDFNHLLTAFITFARLGRDRDNLPEEVVEDLDVIEEQGHRGAQLVRQIRDFSKKKGTLDDLVDRLKSWGFRVGCIHGGMKPGSRDERRTRLHAEQQFREGTIQILVATEAAGEEIIGVRILWDDGFAA